VFEESSKVAASLSRSVSVIATWSYVAFRTSGVMKQNKCMKR